MVFPVQIPNLGKIRQFWCYVGHGMKWGILIIFLLRSRPQSGDAKPVNWVKCYWRKTSDNVWRPVAHSLWWKQRPPWTIFACGIGNPVFAARLRLSKNVLAFASSDLSSLTFSTWLPMCIDQHVVVYFLLTTYTRSVSGFTNLCTIIAGKWWAAHNAIWPHLGW